MNKLELIILTGGFALLLLAIILLLLSYFKRLPFKDVLLSTGTIPFILVFCMIKFKMFASGRNLLIISLLSLLLIPLFSSIISIFKLKKSDILSYRLRVIYFSITTIYCISTIWILFIFWLATDSGFMGASC